MANDYIDQWDLNTVVFDIHDKGRGQPNGVATLDANSKVPDTQLGRGVANGVASLDAEGRIPYSQLPEDALELKGYWDASTNTPQLADGTGTSGDFYFVDVAGSQDLGSGTQYFAVGDRVLYDGSIWKNIASGTVRTINGSGPDAQGNIGGVVKSVNNVAPDANGNCTLTATLSVNGVNPDANGNVNIFGGLVSDVKSFAYSQRTGGQGGFTDETWSELKEYLSEGLLFSYYMRPYLPDGTQLSSGRTIYFIPIINEGSPNVIYWQILSGKTLFSGGVAGWLIDSIQLNKVAQSFATGGLAICYAQFYTWSNTLSAISLFQKFNYEVSSSFQLTRYRLKAQNS